MINDGTGNKLDQVYKQLRGFILSGKFRPGTKISQRAIAKQLGVTTTPVREALLRLEGESLVESLPGLGTRIPPLDASIIRGFAVVRRAIESECARMCAIHASKNELENIMELAEACDKILISDDEVIDQKQLTHYDYQFHLAIAKGTHCRELCNEFTRINIVNIFTHVVSKGHFWARTVPHSKIARAIMDRDEEMAAKIMREHVDAASTEIIRHYDSL